MNPASFLSASLLVALGGGLGAWLRFLAGRLVGAGTFPVATLTVNALGSLAMGLLAGWLARHGPAGALGGEQWRLLLGVGLLGGFTTFSAFSLELALMLERGAMATAAGYALVSVFAGVAGLFAGLALARAIA
jgi:CrcB protein